MIAHVGLTVPDLDDATEFFRRVLGATVEADLVTEPLAGNEVEKGLGLAVGAVVLRVRMLRLGIGEGLELFEIGSVSQANPARVSDLGVQHFAVEVPDMAETVRLVIEAGGRVLAAPAPVPGTSTGAVWAYCWLPWGGLMELLHHPSS